LSHDHCKPVRYNRGLLRKEKRPIGTVWVFRWSEEVNGQRRQHKDVIGTAKEFPTEAAANQEADRRRCRLNENKQYLSLKAITFGKLINHYLNHELSRLSKSARKANKSYIKNWIEPNWHGHLAGGMKAMQIQEWLDKIQRPDGTKLKIKNVLSAIFSHGVRWELVERNPVCGQGGSPGHRGASTGVRQKQQSLNQPCGSCPRCRSSNAGAVAVTRGDDGACRCRHGSPRIRVDCIEVEERRVGDRNASLRICMGRRRIEGDQKQEQPPATGGVRTTSASSVARKNGLSIGRGSVFASPHYHGKTPYTYQIPSVVTSVP
jgi:hypothetical protein